MAPTLATAVDNGMVLILIMVAVVPIAAISFARSGAAWRGIGKGRFAIEQELPPSPSRAPEPEVDRQVQEAEARQMLEAKSYRRTRAGQAPLDVEAEVARLLDVPPRQQKADEALRTEVRQLVVVRNERRMRRGEQPLDVEAETERQLADLIGSG